MFISSRRLALWLLLAALALAPTITGAMPVFHGARYLPYAVLIFSIYAFSFARSRLFKRAALTILSIFFAVTIADLIARPFAPYIFESRPIERFNQQWPPQPHLIRYNANLNFEGETFGDLASVSGRRDWRETHRLRFVTDAYGFRNEPANDSKPLDLILLGDSFGVAGTTTQEEILMSQLVKRSGLKAYNLSVGGHSPLQEYATLVLESGRLPKRDGTILLWLIFTGNDLDDHYYSDLDNPQLWRWSERFVAAYQRFHDRSVVRQLFGSGNPSDLVLNRTFLDGRPIQFSRSYADRTSRTADDVRRHPNFDRLKKTFSLMKTFAGQNHLQVFVALIPSKEEVYSWTINSALPWTSSREPSGFAIVTHELCDANGFRFADLKPTLVEASEKVFKESGQLLWWRDDTHWNGEGQRIAADAIYENLRRYSLP